MPWSASPPITSRGTTRARAPISARASWALTAAGMPARSAEAGAVGVGAAGDDRDGREQVRVGRGHDRGHEPAGRHPDHVDALGVDVAAVHDGSRHPGDRRRVARAPVPAVGVGNCQQLRAARAAARAVGSTSG